MVRLLLAILQLLVEAPRGYKSIILVGAGSGSHLYDLTLVASDELEKIFDLVLSCAASFHGRPETTLPYTERVD